jgi:hypothetical protein
MLDEVPANGFMEISLWMSSEREPTEFARTEKVESGRENKRLSARLKSLRENCAVPKGLGLLSHSTQHSAFGSVLG